MATASDKLQRPRQVTLAGILIMGGSALVVATVFERVAGLNNLETQEAVETFLSQPPGNGLGLDVQGTLTILRTVSMVAAGCAAVAAILGFHVLKRNRGARLGLTILAVPLFLSGLVAGGFLSSVVAASAVMLWMEPARDWFNGIEPRRRPEPQAREPAGPPPPPPPPAPPTEARPHTGFGSVPTTTTPYAAPTPSSGPRPDSVVWACVLTWTLSGLAVVVTGLSAFVAATRPDFLLDEVQRQNPELADQGVTARTLEVGIYVLTGVTTAWALGAILLAVLVYRRVGWARIALVISSAGAALVCVLASVGSLLMVLPVIGCVATFSLLLRPEVRDWFAGS